VFGPVDRFDVEDDTGATMIEYRFEPRRREGPLVMERSLRV